ncbi:MAG: penicillin-binding transpeptidase domain-containing protein, partial [Limosilactobacillus sp.]
FVSKITDSNGKVVKQYKPQVVGHPIKAQTAGKVLNLMQGVVYDQKGLGKAYQIKGHRIAAKTGTAQIGGANGYSSGDTNYLYSMVGMAPAKKPQYIIYITLRQPQNVNPQPADQIAEVFNPTMKMLLDRQSSAKRSAYSMVKVPALTGQTTQAAGDKLGSRHLQAVTVGNGKKVKQQSIPAGQQVLANQRVILYTGGRVQMPDLTGWSSADVNELAQMLNLQLSEQGNGYVDSQSIKANTTITKDQTLVVKYKSKN